MKYTSDDCLINLRCIGGINVRRRYEERIFGVARKVVDFSKTTFWCNSQCRQTSETVLGDAGGNDFRRGPFTVEERFRPPLTCSYLDGTTVGIGHSTNSRQLSRRNLSAYKSWNYVQVFLSGMADFLLSTNIIKKTKTHGDRTFKLGRRSTFFHPERCRSEVFAPGRPKTIIDFFLQSIFNFINMVF